MALFRPDAHPETTSVDGYVRHYVAGGSPTWGDFTGGAGVSAAPSAQTLYVYFSPHWVAPWTPNLWYNLDRGIILINTSSLPIDMEITATLSLYGTAWDGSTVNNGSLNIYSANPNSDTDLIASDFTTLGTTAFCNTPIDIAGWVDNSWNDFVLNSAGLAAISRTGITKFGLRFVEYDVEGTEPTWWGSTGSTAFAIKTADYSDGSYAPKLTITYTTSTMTAGNFAVVETRLHYVGTDSVERYIFGTIIGDAVNAQGNVAVVEDRLHYVGASYTKERYWLGTVIGDATNANGNIAVVENRLQYAAGGKERYIKGIPV